MTAARIRAVSVVAEALGKHQIECTGLGEVTCRGCRDRGWMSWSEFHDHTAEAVVTALEAGMGLHKEGPHYAFAVTDRLDDALHHRLVTAWQEGEG